MKKSILLSFLTIFSLFVSMFAQASFARERIDNFEGHLPIHIRLHNNTAPVGLSPSTIKGVYNLPSTGGSGTIAIVDAYADSRIASDLATFSTTFNLPQCTITNGCLTIHPMARKISSNSGWGLEESLDTQWAHAIAPSAKILLIEASSSSGSSLLSAVDYARRQPGVVSVSMSWGGSEFSGESTYDSYFTSLNGSNITFFASSGDSGSGVQWPAVSSNVTGVGGTTLNFNNGSFSSETAWSGSGGGLSQFETEPGYQSTYSVAQANGQRAVPDVSYDADPNSGVAVYDSLGYQFQSGWFQVGGTSTGSPQWAGIVALDKGVNNSNFYADAISNGKFRDITSGSNGSCGFYCNAGVNYDYVTGLGSPITIIF